MNTNPTLSCRRLINNDWSHAQAIALQQAWRPALEPGFRPATVRTGWTDSALVVFAELEDADIFNPVTELNAELYKYGDVFEMFLRPVNQDPYYEFHIGPQNQKMQLRFPSAETIRAARKTGQLPPTLFFSQPVITSEARVMAEQQRWTVRAEIPFNLVQEVGTVAPGTRWLFSFSRYDYTRGQPKPILSSTSPYQQLNFHAQEDWGTLTFV